MAFNGSGTFVASSSSFNPAVADTVIDETDWETLLTELETALTLCICKDGQSTTTGSITFAAGLRTTNTGLQVLDTNGSHYLTIKPGSDLTAARILTLTTGDAARTLTISADVTLNQSVATTSTPTFAATTITGALTISGASAGQIVFPATQNASADANTLDDYEEGTFTPTISFGGASVGVTYASQTGGYTKVGNRVSYEIELTLSSNGSSTGSAAISGLPFTVGAAIGYAFVVGALIDLNVAGFRYSLAGEQSSTSVNLIEQGDNVAVAAITEADVADAAGVRILGHYRV